MRIGILTYHDGINHGAFLQCYALYRILTSLGHEVMVINYKNIGHWRREYECFLRSPNTWKERWLNAKKILKFAAIKQHLRLTPFTFSQNKVATYHFDTIVVGSDEVWNFTNPIVGYDRLYFGYKLNTKRLASYAASFGCLSPKSNFPEELINGLKKFDVITVRDHNSAQIIKKHLHKNISVVLDPTFLWDVTQDLPPVSSKSFIAVYASGGLSLDYVRALRKFAKMKKLKIISLAYFFSWADESVVSLDPFEWVSYLKQANFILTNTYHGTIYSVILHKSFVSIYSNPSANKISSLLESFSLSNRYCYKTDEMENIFLSPINFTQLEKVKRKLVSDSINHLKKIIGKPL